MSKKLSYFYGLNIYTEKAEYVGRVEEVILDIKEGEVMWLSFKSLKHKTLLNEEIKQILREDTLPYTEILQVGDIVICKKNPKKNKRGEIAKTRV